MQVYDLIIREIFDSRGDSTIEVSVLDKKEREYRAALPSGKSRGSREATAFSVREAERSVAALRASLRRKNFSSVAECDGWLLGRDATPRKERIGGNVALGVSLAVTRALAAERGIEVWRLLREEFFPGLRGEPVPHIFSNLINGGVHAKTNLDVQEYLVIASGKTVLGMTRALIDLYRNLGETLMKKKGGSLPIGDEGGYVLDAKSNFEPIRIVETLIDAMDLEYEFLIGLDVAASALWNPDRKAYSWEGKKRSAEWLLGWYADAFKKSKLLFSVEDPFHEDDAEHFRSLQNTFPKKLIVGDDLTTTRSEAIRSAAEKRVISGVIIKPDQIGTVSEACKSILTAHSSGLRAIVSHRSGETDDPFVIHLAKAGGVFGVKIGAPARERMSKFNELIRLYEKTA